MKVVFTVLGFLWMALGAIGVAVPVLPTTPFLLLAAACFMRGSPRFRAWFQGTRLYRRFVKNLAENHAMTMKGKLRILIPVSTLLIVIFCVMDSVAARIIIVAAMLLKWSYFLFKIKTIKPESKSGTQPYTE